METTRSLVVLLFVIDPISILAHPHCTTVGKLWKSLLVIHFQKTLLKAARPVFQPCFEHLWLAKRITTVSSLHKVLFNIDCWLNENLCIIFWVMNISPYIREPSQITFASFGIWPRTYPPSLHYLCSKSSIFLTTYPPLNANVICEGSLRTTWDFI